MERCKIHSKTLITKCNWCGKKLCELCIAKSTGRLKHYCKDCYASLSKHIDYVERQKELSKISK